MSALQEQLHIDEVSGLDPDAPVVMLNLLKFRAKSLDGHGSGWDAYSRYSANTVPLIKARGGTIIWAGSILALTLGSIMDGNWDYAVLVWYPSPTAFLDMMASPEYAKGNVDRENGTERHLVLATHMEYSKLATPVG